MYQKTSIIGRVSREPDVKEANGTKRASFGVAVQAARDKTIWYNVTAWGKTAETAEKHIHKKMLVFCSGNLNSDDNGNPRVWTDASGNPRASFELNVYEMKILTWPDKPQVDVDLGGLSIESATNSIPLDLSVDLSEIPF